MPTLRRLALSAAAAPIALALAACGSNDEAPAKGEAIAAIAAPAGQSWVDTAAVTPEGGYVIGNPDAPLKLVEYASHTCSHCAAFSQEAAAKLDEYVEKGVVSYEIRNQIHDPIDLSKALLARCGTPQTFHPLANQAWQNFETLMTTAQANGAALQQAPLACKLVISVSKFCHAWFASGWKVCGVPQRASSAMLRSTGSWIWLRIS